MERGNSEVFTKKSQPTLQTRLNKHIQIAIQNGLWVAGFDIGAQIFDARLIQHIGANLAAPTHIGFRGFQGLLVGHTVHHLQLVKF